MNTEANYIETTNSNIFILKEDKVYTPPLTDGCVDGTMRNWVLLQESVIEKSLNQIDVEAADEVFIANAINGIVAINRVDDITYTTFNYAQNLQEKLISSSSDL